MLRSQFPKLSLQGGQQRHLSVLRLPGPRGELVLDGNQKPCQEAVGFGNPGARFPARVVPLWSFAGGVTGLWGWPGLLLARAQGG